MLRRGLLQCLQHAQTATLAASCMPPAAGPWQGSAAAAACQLAHYWPAALQQWPAQLWQQQQRLLPHSLQPTPACQMHTTTAAFILQHHVALDRLRPAPGSSKLAKRWGRGDGGDRGTYCGRGVKGQKARKGGKPHLIFDGGQKTMKKFPKVWITPSSPVLYRQVGLSKVLRWVQLGLLDASQPITMKDLRDSGCASKTIRWGVELVAHGAERVRMPLHLQVSSVSPEALRLVEAAGGSVTRVYYTRLGLRALLKPEVWEAKGKPLPRPVRAWPPRDNGRFDVVGQLPPAMLMGSPVTLQLGSSTAAT